jgi:hypothetical protein
MFSSESLAGEFYPGFAFGAALMMFVTTALSIRRHTAWITVCLGIAGYIFMMGEKGERR